MKKTTITACPDESIADGCIGAVVECLSQLARATLELAKGSGAIGAGPQLRVMLIDEVESWAKYLDSIPIVHNSGLAYGRSALSGELRAEVRLLRYSLQRPVCTGAGSNSSDAPLFHYCIPSKVCFHGTVNGALFAAAHAAATARLMAGQAEKALTAAARSCSECYRHQPHRNITSQPDQERSIGCCASLGWRHQLLAMALDWVGAASVCNDHALVLVNMAWSDKNAAPPDIADAHKRIIMQQCADKDLESELSWQMAQPTALHCQHNQPHRSMKTQQEIVACP